MFNKNFLLSAVIVALTSTISPVISNVKADELRVATVDMDRILNETTEAQAKRKELDKMKEQKKAGLETQKKTLTQLEAKLKGQKVNAASKEADDFRARARDFSRLAHDAEEDLKHEYLRTTKILIDKAQKIIDAYAAEQKFNLVLERGKTQRSTVLYSNNSMDITDEVIARMNKK